MFKDAQVQSSFSGVLKQISFFFFFHKHYMIVQNKFLRHFLPSFLYFLDYCCIYGGGDPRAQTQRRNKAKVLAGLARPSVALVQIILC